MLTIWRCVSPSIPDHNFSYGPVWTATSESCVEYRTAFRLRVDPPSASMGMPVPVVVVSISSAPWASPSISCVGHSAAASRGVSMWGAH